MTERTDPMGKLWDIVQAHIDATDYPPSERQVAKRLGVSPTTLRNWRTPKSLPDLDNLVSLSKLVGVPYSEVLAAALEDVGYVAEGAAIAARPGAPAAAPDRTAEEGSQEAESDEPS
jgi:transcriptional regulator with XRE-family HTH domain